MLLPLHILLSAGGPPVVDAPGCVDLSDAIGYHVAVADGTGQTCSLSDARAAVCVVTDERSCA